MKRQATAGRNMRILLAGQTINMFGNTAMTIVLGIWVKNLTGSSAAAGLIFLLIAATAFLAPATGPPAAACCTPWSPMTCSATSTACSAASPRA